MNALPTTPGLYYSAVPPPEPLQPLRTDIAGFIGRTRRGPIGEVVRVVGWREYLAVFGDLERDAFTSYSLRGYFANGGEIAHVVRVSGPGPRTAETVWTVGTLDPATGSWDAASRIRGGFAAPAFRLRATSPGTWGDSVRVSIQYRARNTAGLPELDVVVSAEAEPTESFPGVRPEELDVALRASRLVRALPEGPVPVPLPANAPSGPATRLWRLRLGNGSDVAPTRADYLEAVRSIMETREVALIGTPDLHDDLAADRDAQREVVQQLARRADEEKDRLVLVDLPGALTVPLDVVPFVAELADSFDFPWRALAVYHPRLHVPDPLGGVAHPLRSTPPSGVIAGMISRLDRERGAYHTPANAPLFDAVDIEREFDEAERTRFHEEGVNVVRCIPGRGLMAWGGRTPDKLDTGRFIAHRRLLHRLVRAIGRVAEPLVFDVNGPELRLTFRRAITTVLVEAFRAGALKGARPEEAFTVVCDETNNTADDVDAGRVLCEIGVAPAVPMEFIHLRVAFSGEGRLEVFE